MSFPMTITLPNFFLRIPKVHMWDGSDAGLNVPLIGLVGDMMEPTRVVVAGTNQIWIISTGRATYEQTTAGGDCQGMANCSFQHLVYPYSGDNQQFREDMIKKYNCPPHPWL